MGAQAALFIVQAHAPPQDGIAARLLKLLRIPICPYVFYYGVIQVQKHLPDNRPIKERTISRMSNLPVPSYPRPPEPAIVTAANLPAVDERKRRGCGGCLGCAGLVSATLIVAVAAVIITLLLSGGGAVNAIFDGVRSLVAPVTSATVGDAQTIVTSIAPLSQLVTISAQLARADVPVRVASGALNACGYSAYHVIQGTIEAGVDLSLVGPDDIVFNPNTDRYTLTVPGPQYTNCSVDYSRQYQQSFTTCVADWDAARILAEYTSMQDMLEDTFEGGLLERAGTEATRVLAGFITALTGKPVDIVFDSARQPRVPEQCARRAPPGWTYDAALNRWQHET